MKKIASILFLIAVFYGCSYSQIGWTSQRTKINFRDSLKIQKDANFYVAPRFQDGFKIGNTLVTTNATEFNILDGALVNTIELNRLVGVTSSVQNQLDSKAPIASPVFTGSYAKIGTDTLATRAYARAVAGYGGGGGSATWGLITGTLNDQLDLKNALDAKAPLNSPTFTGTPIVPGYVPTTTTVNGKSLSSNITLTLSDVGFSYPSSGIVVSTGSGWGTPITDNSTNWNTAYTERMRWDGGSAGLSAATGRASLGATTVGSNLFTLTNPSAIRFIMINADNTVSALSNTDFKTALSLTASDVGLGNVTNESKTTMFTNPTFTGTAKLNTDTLATRAYVRSSLDQKEDNLGNPSVNGYVLASTTNGVRSWVLNGSGGSGSNLNIINVTDYGVYNDGATDNTTTLESLVTSNNTYFFPRGTYVIERADFDNLNNVRFLGEAGTIFTSDGTGTDYHILFFTGTSTSNILIENIKFQSTAVQSSEQGDGLIRFEGKYLTKIDIDNVIIRNCEFTCPNLNTNGITLFNNHTDDEFTNFLIEDCYFHDIGRIGIEVYGVYTSGYTSKFRRLTFLNNRFYEIGEISYGIAISLAGDYITVANNTIINCLSNQAIELGHGNYHTCTGNKIIGDGIDTFWATSLSYVDKVIYSNNIISIPQIDAALSNMTIEISNCKRIQVVNNNIEASGSIKITDTDAGVVSENYIKSPYQVGIFLAGGVDSLLVSNNRIWMNNTANIGGIIINGNTSQNQYNVIENNYITAADGIRYTFEYMTATNNVVIDNKPYTGSLTDGAPTASQIATILGLTSACGAGSRFIIKDSDGSGLTYHIISTGTAWHYLTTTPAL